MALGSNLALRARLLRLALGRRFVHDEILAMAEERGLKIADVRGGIHPLELVARLGGDGRIPQVDFSALRGDDLIVEHGHTTHWASEPSVAQFLGQLTLLRAARVVIEVGCFVGWTTVHIATALRQLGAGGRVHYVDYDSAHLQTAKASIERLALGPWATPHHGSSLDPALQKQLPAAANIVFIDTTHEYEQTRAEIAHYRGRLAPGGCLVLHDSISLPGVRRAVREVEDQFDVCTFATERSNGVTVLLPRPT